MAAASLQDELRAGGSGAYVPLGLAAGLPGKGDSAFARLQGGGATSVPKKPCSAGSSPELPSAGVSAFATYTVRGDCDHR